jgi:hypothetical protein
MNGHEPAAAAPVFMTVCRFSRLTTVSPHGTVSTR